MPNESSSEDDEDYNAESTLIDESVKKWETIPLCSSVSFLRASYPSKTEESDNDSISLGSFCNVNEEEVKSEDGSYSVQSEDERKRPAKEVAPRAHRRLEIKMEDEEETKDSSNEPHTLDPPKINAMNTNLFDTTFIAVAKPDWMRNNDEPMMRPSWVRSEGHDYFDSENEYETDQEYYSEGGDQSLKRQRSHDEPSYFDKFTQRKDDDETGPSSGPGSKSSDKIMPCTRRYHFQTRQTTRRTRSAHKKYKSNNTKMRSVRAKKPVRKARSPSHGLTPCHANVNSAMMKGQIQRRVIPPERLIKAWKIDRDTAVRTIRATSYRYQRKLDSSMK